MTFDPDELDPAWYHDRPIPERLLDALHKAPKVPEDLIPKSGSSAIGMVRRRRDRLPTDRALHVLALVSHGLEAEHVADVLGIGAETVKTHLKHARYVLRAKNTAHAVAVALREGLID